MNLDDKIAHARKVIFAVLPYYEHPIIMSSFGKDSMVLLSLIEQAGFNFPVLFHREPFFPEKYAFANRVIETKKLTVYDYPPSLVGIAKSGQSIELVNWYSVGGNRHTYLPTGIRTPVEGQSWLCGYRDLYKKPTVPSFTFPWDLCFVGHKTSDVDPIFGPVPIEIDLKKNALGPDFAFPLRFFTDDDIWMYRERFALPVNDKRYGHDSSKGGYFEREDITFNNDYHYACTRCMDPDGPTTVICPLINLPITNISRELVQVNIERDRPAYMMKPSETVQ